MSISPVLRVASIVMVAGTVIASCSSDRDGASNTTIKSSSSSSAPSAAVTTTTVARPSTSAGCDPSAPVPASATDAVPFGDSQVDLTSGGKDRYYLRHIPANYAVGTAMPVIVDLHGYQEGAAIHTSMSSLGVYGDKEGFITITPQGSANPVPRWDVDLASPDVAFIGDVLDDIEATLCVDLHRVFAAGLSNGAFMTSSLACAYADRLAAVAPVAGVRSNVKNCKPARAVPLITFHGTADGFVAFDGGLGKAALELPTPDGKGKIGDNPAALEGANGPSVPEQVAGWAKRNGCDPKATETKVAADVTLVSYKCPVDADVMFYRVEGGGHAWPGSEFSKNAAAILGVTTFSISANELMWKFFTEHPLPK